MFYKIMYTIFKTHTREAYIYAAHALSAIEVFKQSAADLGLSSSDYEVDFVFELNYIDESIVMQGVDHEAGKD